MSKIKPGIVAVALVLAACAGKPDIVPVAAAPNDLLALAGRWEGQYETKESEGRSGLIYFDLKQGRDTASGYVIMTFAMPPQDLRPRAGVYPAPPLGSEQHSIRFVRARDGLITGELDHYVDPSCGCRLATTFSGRVRANRIRGSFTTRHIDTNTIVRGTWSATRQPNP